MLTISIRRNQIAFENLPEKCLCGNSDHHIRAAVKGWIDAATRSLEAAGYTADVKIGHKNNPASFMAWISDAGKDEDGERIVSSDAQDSQAKLAAEIADEDGWTVAREDAEADCSTTDEDWQEMARRMAADAEELAEFYATLPADLREATVRRVAGMASKSRNARKRVWRSLHLSLGDDRLAALRLVLGINN
jgi:hypothetical protein